MSDAYRPEQLATFEHELRQDPALVDRILSQPDIFPPVPQVERVIICTDEISVDMAIAKATALAVTGIEPHIKLASE